MESFLLNLGINKSLLVRKKCLDHILLDQCLVRLSHLSYMLDLIHAKPNGHVQHYSWKLSDKFSSLCSSS